MSNGSRLDKMMDKIRSAGSTGPEPNVYVHNQIIDTSLEGSGKDNSEIEGNATPGVRKNKPKKKKFEDLYTRDTVYWNNESKKVLDKMVNNERGEKTRIINEALREYLEKRGLL